MASLIVKNSASRKEMTHPSTWDMLKAALIQLKDRNGSSRQALAKFLATNYDVKMTEVYKSVVRRTLAKAVSDGKLLKNKASFKLSPTEKVAASKPKTVLTKKTSSGPTATAAARKKTPTQKTKKTKDAKNPKSTKESGVSKPKVTKKSVSAMKTKPKVGTPPKKNAKQAKPKKAAVSKKQ